jgi:hypothetical protein
LALTLGLARRKIRALGRGATPQLIASRADDSPRANRVCHNSEF